MGMKPAWDPLRRGHKAWGTATRGHTGWAPGTRGSRLHTVHCSPGWTANPTSAGRPGPPLLLQCPQSGFYSRALSGPWPELRCPVSPGELHPGTDSKLQKEEAKPTPRRRHPRAPPPPASPADRLEVRELGPAFLLCSQGAGGAGCPQPGTHSWGWHCRVCWLIKHHPCGTCREMSVQAS